MNLPATRRTSGNTLTGIEDLKDEAKKQELWNLFLPKEYAPWSPGLTNVEIAVLFETMSRSAWAQQVFQLQCA